VILGSSPTTGASFFFPPEKLIGPTFKMLLLRRLSTMCRKFDEWEDIADDFCTDDIPDIFVSALVICVV
jgi:hypothetical protein